MKKCCICKESKPLTEFRNRSDSSDGLAYSCTTCIRVKDLERSQRMPFNRLLSTKKHASKHIINMECDLDLEYLKSIWTDTCPIFGIPISFGLHTKGVRSTVQLDRVNPDKGYIKGNVIFLSTKANRIKSNATSQELRAIADWIDKQQSLGD